MIEGGDLEGFFRDRLLAAGERRLVHIPELTEYYLVQLLCHHAVRASGPELQRPLVEQLADALAAEDSQERFRRLRALGDTALYLSGFFADHLARRGVSQAYVAAMGGRAYRSAESLSRWTDSAFTRVFDDLAGGFQTYAAVLDEVRESTELRTPQDIVRLYDRWRRTGSPLLAERLRREGVYPQSGGKGELH